MRKVKLYSVLEVFVRRMNRTKPLLADEWKIVADSAGMSHTVQVVLNMLEDEKPKLILPKEIVLKAGIKLRNSMQQITTAQGESKLMDAFTKYMKLVMLQVGSEQSDAIPTLLKEMWDFLTRTPSLNEIWPNRFMLLAILIDIIAPSEASSDERLTRLFNDTPSYLKNFVKAHYAAVIASSGNVDGLYQKLMTDTTQDRNSEAWFLVTLVRRERGKESLEIAKKSDRASELLPRLNRAWLCTHPESAALTISSEDMVGDPIGKFFAQGSVQNRIDYLRKVTDNGTRSVPGAMWAGADTDEEPKGIRGFWKNLMSSNKTLEEIIEEYTVRNPLYSSYHRSMKKAEQFIQYLRIKGFGEYTYAEIDDALIQALVTWGDNDAAQVYSVLQAMWNAIQPDDNILMADWLRNAILTRCRNVFAADPKVLIDNYLEWLKKELVDKGRIWQYGRTQISMKLPDTVPFAFCVASAQVVSGHSPSRRDQILLTGLDRFLGDPTSIENAAIIYNADKELLDLAPPLQLKPNLIEAWQLGVVKSAIPQVLVALCTFGARMQEEAAPDED